MSIETDETSLPRGICNASRSSLFTESSFHAYTSLIDLSNSAIWSAISLVFCSRSSETTLNSAPSANISGISHRTYLSQRLNRRIISMDKYFLISLLQPSSSLKSFCRRGSSHRAVSVMTLYGIPRRQHLQPNRHAGVRIDSLSSYQGSRPFASTSIQSMTIDIDTYYNMSAYF
jgi:hypothetical protein